LGAPRKVHALLLIINSQAERVSTMWADTTKAYREAGLVAVAGSKIVIGGVTFAVNDSGQLVLTD
jgi:hypothetical protein